MNSHGGWDKPFRGRFKRPPGRFLGFPRRALGPIFGTRFSLPAAARGIAPPGPLARTAPRGKGGGTPLFPGPGRGPASPRWARCMTPR